MLFTTNEFNGAMNCLQGKTLDANRYATKKTVAQGKRSELKRMEIRHLDENIAISDNIVQFCATSLQKCKNQPGKRFP